MDLDPVLHEEVPMEEKVVDGLKARGLTLTTAESCTGGLLAGTLINVSGISEVFHEGYITYANASKEKILGVKKETLENDGAVSENCAREMAVGAVKASGARASLAVTGIAGPGGGTEEKPVGLVYIGCCIDNQVWVERHQFQGDRQTVRSLTVQRAMAMLCWCMTQWDER